MRTVWFIHIYQTEEQKVPTDFRITSVLLNGAPIEKPTTRVQFQSGVYTIVFDGSYCAFFRERFKNLIEDVTTEGVSISFRVVGELYYTLD